MQNNTARLQALGLQTVGMASFLIGLFLLPYFSTSAQPGAFTPIRDLLILSGFLLALGAFFWYDAPRSRRSKYSTALKLEIIGLVSFVFGFFIMPIIYDTDYTNNNPSALLDAVNNILVVGGFLLTVGVLLWAIFFKVFQRNVAALIGAFGIVAAIAFLTIFPH